jgi:hypothetical protein
MRSASDSTGEWVVKVDPMTCVTGAEYRVLQASVKRRPRVSANGRISSTISIVMKTTTKTGWILTMNERYLTLLVGVLWAG